MKQLPKVLKPGTDMAPIRNKTGSLLYSSQRAVLIGLPPFRSIGIGSLTAARYFAHPKVDPCIGSTAHPTILSIRRNALI